MLGLRYCAKVSPARLPNLLPIEKASQTNGPPAPDAGSGYQHPIDHHSCLAWSPDTTPPSVLAAVTPLFYTMGMGNITS